MNAVRDIVQKNEFAALVGIDWADQKHDICLLDTTTGRREAAVVEHTPEAIDDWVAQLRCRFFGVVRWPFAWNSPAGSSCLCPV